MSDDTALVGFRDDVEAGWQHLLKPGYRHCWCAVNIDDTWIEVDGGPRVPRLRVSSGDLPAFYRTQPIRFLVGPYLSDWPKSPLIRRDCVGMVKAVLGIRSWAVTPWQLYRALEARGWTSGHSPTA